MGGKVKYYRLSESARKKYLGDFYKIVASLNGYDEVKNFFKDLLSLSEIIMIARRLQIAEKLLDEMNYEEIKKELRVGGSNIAKVDHWLNNGFGGYKTVLKRLREKRLKKEAAATITPYSLDRIRKKYPSHFALLNLLIDNKK